MKVTRSHPKHSSVVHHSKNHDGYTNGLLRGVAILAVLVLHTLSTIHFGFRETNPLWQHLVALDQLCRFGVPLFVALSAFSFWQKYQKVEFHWFKFLFTQARKLLPLYVLASIIFYVEFSLAFHLQAHDVLQSFTYQVLMGQADYHLYFVPMIFQLYLLFPILMLVVRKWFWLSLFAAAAFQVWLYLLFSSPTPSLLVTKYFLTDQQQYRWFFTWIFYFVLGMHLPAILSWVKAHSWSLGLLGVGSAVAWWRATQQGLALMLSGIDPIIALRATRLEVFLYASITIVFLFAVAELINAQFRKFSSWCVKLGKISYIAYLFHPLVLQLIFSFV